MRSLKNFINTLLLVAASMLVPQGTRASDGEPIRVDRENLAKLSATDQARVLEIVDRLESITEMDRSELTRPERKCLREETRELRREATAFNNQGGGTVVYISAGTIIIILLIILILT